MAFQQIAGVAEADVGVVDREPAEAGQHGQNRQPRCARADEQEPPAHGRRHSDIRLNSPSGSARINNMMNFQIGRT